MLVSATELMETMSEGQLRLLVVKTEDCEGCKQFVGELDKPEIKAFVKQKTGLDAVEVVDIQKDDVAVNIVSSLDNYEVPMITSLKKLGDGLEVCQLDENLEVKKCAPYKEMPKEEEPPKAD
jgi:hypothetical protein